MVQMQPHAHTLLTVLPMLVSASRFDSPSLVAPTLSHVNVDFHLLMANHALASPREHLTALVVSLLVQMRHSGIRMVTFNGLLGVFPLVFEEWQGASITASAVVRRHSMVRSA